MDSNYKTPHVIYDLSDADGYRQMVSKIFLNVMPSETTLPGQVACFGVDADITSLGKAVLKKSSSSDPDKFRKSFALIKTSKKIGSLEPGTPITNFSNYRLSAEAGREINPKDTETVSQLNVTQIVCLNLGEAGMKHLAKFLSMLQSPFEIFIYDSFGPHKGLVARGSSQSRKLFLRVKKLRDIPMSITKWFWPGVFPEGANSLWFGAPGAGKSTATYDFLSRCTTGADWPDGSKNLMGPVDVLLVTFSEDRLDTTVRPAMELNGADLDRVHCIEGMDDEQGEDAGGFKIEHLPSIEEYLDSNPQIRIVCINPLSAGFGKGAMNDGQDVRNRLDPLNECAERRNISFLIVHHDKKGQESSVVNKVSGSQQIIGTVRAAFYFVVGKRDAPCSMASTKSNLSEGSGMKYEIVKVPHPLGPEADEHNVGFPKINWLGKESKTAQELLEDSDNKAESKIGRCRQYIKATLAVSPQLRSQFYSWAETLGEASDEANRKVMQRAADELQIVAAKQSNGDVMWSLPTSVPEIPSLF